MENDEKTKLVKRGELVEYLGKLLEKEKAVAEELRNILPHLTVKDIKDSLQKRLAKAEECVAALEQGYVPIDGWFTNVEWKNKWQKRAVEEVLKTMPDEIKAAWERAKELGVFKSFGVTGGRRGDPMLVGNAGGRHFLIGAWLNLPGGSSIGVTPHHRRHSPLPNSVILYDNGTGHMLHYEHGLR